MSGPERRGPERPGAEYPPEWDREPDEVDAPQVDSLVVQMLAQAWERGYAAGVRHVPGQWIPNPFLCDEAVYIYGALSPCGRIAGHDGDHQYAFEATS